MITDIIWYFSLIGVVCFLFAVLYELMNMIIRGLINIAKRRKENNFTKIKVPQRYDRSHCTDEYFKKYFRNEL